MSKHEIAKRIWAVAFGLSLSVAAMASDWSHYESKPYGFSMLVPAGTRLATREWGGGWGGMNASHEGVKFDALAKLGPKESDTDLERYALRVIGLNASAWTRTDQAFNTRGWERSYVFKAKVGSRLIFGMYGVGKKGNYLLYLDTTPGDYMHHKAEYDKWYESIRLD